MFNIFCIHYFYMMPYTCIYRSFEKNSLFDEFIFFLLGQNDIFANVGPLVSCLVCRPSDIYSISFDPLICLKVAKLGRVDARRDQVSPIDFQATWSKVKVKMLVFEKMKSSHYYLTPMLESCQTWHIGCLQGVDDPN